MRMKGNWVPIETYVRRTGLPMEAVEEMIGDNRIVSRSDDLGRTLVCERPLPRPQLEAQEPIPGRFAERAMNSLMHLHQELMDEKERRLELYRRLMEREQAVAELQSLVRLLERELEATR